MEVGDMALDDLSLKVVLMLLEEEQSRLAAEAPDEGRAREQRIARLLVDGTIQNVRLEQDELGRGMRDGE